MSGAGGTQQSERRALRFETLDQLLSDARNVAQSDERGTLRSTGNWSAGQALGHLAAWINYAYDGFPMKPLPWVLRMIAKPMTRRMLRSGLKPGFSFKGVAGGTYGTERLTTRDGLERLEAAVSRLKSAAPTQASPLFGTMPHQQWIQLHLRHGELHLSFFHPGSR